MKNFLYLEPDEEFPSILKKLQKCKSKTIDLVVPLGSVFFKQDNLEIIKNEIEKIQKQTTIHSNDTAGLKLAKKVGLEITTRQDFDSKKVTNQVKKTGNIKIIYKKGNEPSPNKLIKKNTKVSSTNLVEKDIVAKKTPKNEAKPGLFNQVIFYILLAISALIVLFVFLFIVPQTDIEITTQAKITPFQGDVTLDTKQKNVDPINNIIPAQIITLEETVETEARATGQTNNGQKATGVITVYNQTSAPVPLMGGTRFVSKDELLFRSTGSVNIPGNGSANVNVESDIVGTKGNIGPSRFYLPALNGSDVIYGQTAQAMSGGTDEITYNISNEDLKYSTQELSQKIYAKALEDLKTKLPKGKQYLSADASGLKPEITADHQVGDQVETFKIIAKTSVNFLVYDQKQLQELVNKNLSKNISKDRTFVSNDSEGLNTKLINLDLENKKATINVATSAVNTPIYNTDVIKNNIAGKSEEEVKEYFLNYPEIQQIEVGFWPDWSKRVSKIPSRINITIIWK